MSYITITDNKKLWDLMEQPFMHECKSKSFFRDAIKDAMYCSLFYKRKFLKTFSKMVDIYIAGISIDDPYFLVPGPVIRILNHRKIKNCVNRIVICLPIDLINSIESDDDEIIDKLIDFYIFYGYGVILRLDRRRSLSYKAELTFYDHLFADSFAFNKIGADKELIKNIYEILELYLDHIGVNELIALESEEDLYRYESQMLTTLRNRRDMMLESFNRGISLP